MKNRHHYWSHNRKVCKNYPPFRMVGFFLNNVIIIKRNKSKKGVVAHFFEKFPSGNPHQQGKDENVDGIDYKIVHKFYFSTVGVFPSAFM